MAASSLLYVGPAFAWMSYNYWWLGRCFCLVAVLSVGADSGGGILPEANMKPLRIADRAVGTVALLSSVVFNSTSPTNCAFSIIAVVTSLCWLAKGRAVRSADPTARWTYLFFHGGWHAYGAAALVAVTRRAQS